MFHWIPALILLLCQGPTGSEAGFGALAAKVPTQHAQAGKVCATQLAGLPPTPSASEIAVWAALLLAAQAAASSDDLTIPKPAEVSATECDAKPGDVLPDDPVLQGGRTRDGPRQ